MEAISSQAILAVLVQLLVLCLIIERALHFIFRLGLWRSFFGTESNSKGVQSGSTETQSGSTEAQSNSKEIKSLKALIVLGISYWVCFSYDINAILEITSPGTTISPEDRTISPEDRTISPEDRTISQKDRTIREFLGIGITALVIAGGSAGIREIIKTMSPPKPNS